MAYAIKGVFMPRPVHPRIIEKLPQHTCFLPEAGSTEAVQLQLDEWEAIRLMDLEHLDQSSCAKRMHIARTTAQNIINSAREKLADALIHGKRIEIYGGEVSLYQPADSFHSCCQVESVDRLGGISSLSSMEDTMNIAVTYDNGNIFQHFGKTEFFKLYSIENRQVASSRVVSTNGQGHGALAGLLTSLKVDVLICDGIGGGAQAALAEAGIRLFGGVSGNADEAVQAFLTDSLSYQEDIRCDHHDGHEEGGCHHTGGHCH